METILEETKSETQQHIADMQQALDALQFISDDLRGVIRIHIDKRGKIYLVTIFDLTTYRHNRALLQAAGWKVTSVFVVSDSGNRYARMERNEISMAYIMDVQHSESTCTRTRVAVVELPVYEVQCS